MIRNEKKNYSLKVGYTVFTGLVIFFLFIILVGTEGYYFSKTYNLNMYVKNTNGLIEGSKVYLGGLKVGAIDKIEFTTVGENNLVLLRLEILEKYKSRITVNSYAKIETSGLLGDKLINISLGDPSEKPLNENDFIPVKESLSFDNLTDKIDPIVYSIDKIANNIAVITDSLNGKSKLSGILFGMETSNDLKFAIKQLNSLASKLNNGNNTFSRLINEDSLYTGMKTLVDNLQNISDTLKSGKGTIGKLIVNDSLYNNINEITRNLEKVASSLNNNSTLAGGILNNPDGYEKLEILLDQLAKLIEDMNTNPEKYFHISVF
ncbi:Mammalian cell entry related domain-containing protein [Melioribacter roseus P3M-2]|uniref:Mammalian cell entry related domain-containing protein n=1 Tax=Melioribacter roseus (strain DSM 23840 / JCM 17771 / VKM B-2668 / P3M-2) TaxID=1191523 RepID=I6ZZU2_MELRP|nr:MlaD family protein [Melioribacter roseus]AFN74498.1 Mammalian cell entry related domain-containing protein [Melioribacter roseus P3M-2]